MSRQIESPDQSNQARPGPARGARERYRPPVLHGHGIVNALTGQSPMGLAAVGLLPPLKAVLSGNRQWPPRSRGGRRRRSE